MNFLGAFIVIAAARYRHGNQLHFCLLSICDTALIWLLH